jgi:Protein of unknown function (DUF433)
MPVSAVFENLEAGATIDEIVEQFDISREQINEVLEFAARSLDAPAAAPSSMLILFDHVTPKGIARALVGHTVTKAKDRGWDTLSNGDLLAVAGRKIASRKNSSSRNRRHAKAVTRK